VGLTLLLVGIGVGVALGVSFIMRPAQAQPLKSLRELKRLSVGSVLEGRVCKIEGKVRLDKDTLVAPVSGRPCVYYVVRIETPGPSGADGWANLLRETEGCDFVIDDGTGRVRVEVEGADVTLVKDVASYDPSTLEDGPGKEFMVKHRRFFDEVRVRVLEGVIEEGEAVAIRGFAATEADPSGHPTDYRAPAKRVVIRDMPGVPLYISDVPSALDKKLK